MRLLEYSMAGGLTVFGTALMIVGHFISTRVITILDLDTMAIGFQFREIGLVLILVGLMTGTIMFILRKLRLLY